MVQTYKPLEKADQERWSAQWGYADSQGFGVSTSMGLAEFVTWDEADRVMGNMIDRFGRQEQADHDAIETGEQGETPDAVALLERRQAESRPRGQEWGCVVESVTGHRYMFVIEWDGPKD